MPAHQLKFLYDFARTHPRLWQYVSPIMYSWDARKGPNCALRWAVRHKNMNTLKRALNEAQADPNRVPLNGFRRASCACRLPLLHSVVANDKLFTELLLQHGARTDDNDSLIQAVDAGNVDIIALLIIYNADPGRRNGSRESAIGRAVENGNWAAVDLFLRSGKADANSTTGHDETPLIILAAVNRDTNMISLLLRYGADIQARDSKNETAIVKVQLRRAPSPELREFDITKFLQDHGAHFEEKKDYDKWRKGAIQRGSTDILRHLDSLAVPYDSATSLNNLMSAIFRKKYSVVEYLLQSDPNLLDCTRVPHWAISALVQGGQESIIEQLLTRGAAYEGNAGTEREFGYSHVYDPTPLWYAAWHNNSKLCRLFLDKGASPFIEARKKSKHRIRWVLDLAILHGNDVMTDMLLDYYNSSKWNRNFKPPLKQMILRDKTHLVERMLATGLEINRPDEWCQSPSFLAIVKDRLGMMKLFLRYGADANEIVWSHYDYNDDERPRKGISLLRFALKKGRFDIANVLREAGGRDFELGSDDNANKIR